MRYVMSLENLTLLVHLGVTPEERKWPQPLQIEINLESRELPLACESDQLADTICYVELAKTLQEFCLSRSFNLLENFAYQLFQFLKQSLLPQIKLILRASKNPIMRPYLAHSVFTICD